MPYAYCVRMDDNEREILEELKELPKYKHLSKNDLIITAIKELNKKEFR